MSKYFSHTELESRIRNVMRNIDYKEHHAMLEELFPEIHKAVKDAEFQDTYKIGNVYIRVGHVQENVISLVMPVAIRDCFGRSGTKWEVKLLNLIAGNFWSGTVFIDNANYSLTQEQWDELTGNKKDRFIRLGWFEHDFSKAILKLQGDRKIGLFKIEDKHW